MTQTDTPLDWKRIRKRAREEMPTSLFEPQVDRGIWGFIVTGINIALALVIIYLDPPWYLSFLISILIGQFLVCVGFITHEALHGSVFRSKFMQDLIGWIGFSLFLITPYTWRIWHVQIHHGNTNNLDKDPDMIGRLGEVQKSRFHKLLAIITPGSGHWISYVSMFLLFTLQGQVIVWFYAKTDKFPAKFNHLRARLETLGAAFFWVTLGCLIGFKASCFVIIFPMLMANFTIMSYIATQHWMLPATRENNPFENALSVNTIPLFDLLHVNFSYHQEHHIFPSMSPRFAPLLRKTISQFAPHAMMNTAHWRALYWLYATPRLYRSDTVLADVSAKKNIPTSWLKQQLQV